MTQASADKPPKPSSKKPRRKRLKRTHLSQWFVVKTKTGQERHAAIWVRRKGHMAFAPYVSTEDTGVHRESPLFPGHIFVFGLQWYYLKATPGVLYPIMMGATPGYMPITEMQALLRASGVDDLIEVEDREKITPGVQLRIRSGPWKDRWGKFLGVKGKERVRMLMDVLGSQHELEFERRVVTTRKSDPVSWRELVEKR